MPKVLKSATVFKWSLWKWRSSEYSSSLLELAMILVILGYLFKELTDSFSSIMFKELFAGDKSVIFLWEKVGFDPAAPNDLLDPIAPIGGDLGTKDSDVSPPMFYWDLTTSSSGVMNNSYSWDYRSVEFLSRITWNLFYEKTTEPERLISWSTYEQISGDLPPVNWLSSTFISPPSTSM